MVTGNSLGKPLDLDVRADNKIESLELLPCEESTEEAVVLIDPVSTGRFLKEYVVERGYKIIAIFTLDQEQLRRSGKFIPYDEKTRLCSHTIHTGNVAEAINFINGLPYRIVAVIPASEPGVELADQLAERLGVIGNEVSTTACRRNKHAMRRAVQTAGLQGPAFAACCTTEDAILFARQHGMPVVLKTPKGAGAHHVFICKNCDDVVRAHSAIIEEANIFGDCASQSLIEEYVTGPQFVLEYLGDGKDLTFIALWRTLRAENRFGSEYFYQIDLVTDDQELDRARHLISYGRDTLRAVGLRWGPCLVELRDDAVKGPMLIEVGARLSGIDLPLLTRVSSNIDLFGATLDVYIHPRSHSRKPIQFHQFASLVLCSTHEDGVVFKLPDPSLFEELKSTLSIKCTVEIGDKVFNNGDLASIPFYIYMVNESRSALESDIFRARQIFADGFEVRS